MPQLSDRDARGCVLIGPLEDFVQRLDEGPAARSLHYLAGRLHMTGGNAAELQSWVAAVRTRFDATFAACFEAETPCGAPPSIVCDPPQQDGHALAIDAMGIALAESPVGAAVAYSSAQAHPSPASGRSCASGAAVKCGAGRMLGFLLVRENRSAADEGAVLQYIVALAWHMQCASQSQARTRPRGTQLSPAELVEAMPLPCVLTDAAGRAIERNEGFARFMESVAMHVSTGRLRFDDPYLHESWHVALQEVHLTALRQSLLAAAPDGRLWRVHLVPLQCALDERDPTERALILAVVEQQAAMADAPIEMAMPDTARPLTPAESEVLGALLQGHSAKVIANSRNASVNTVRSQIMTILEKTGYHNQRSLIAAFAPSAFRSSAMSSFAPATGSSPPSRSRR